MVLPFVPGKPTKKVYPLKKTAPNKQHVLKHSIGLPQNETNIDTFRKTRFSMGKQWVGPTLVAALSIF